MANLSIIRALCKKKNISLVKLGKEIGIKTPQGVQRIINENSTTIEKLEKIAKVLEVPIWMFFDMEQESNYIREMEQVKNQIEINKETLDLMTQQIKELKAINENMKVAIGMLTIQGQMLIRGDINIEAYKVLLGSMINHIKNGFITNDEDYKETQAKLGAINLNTNLKKRNQKSKR